MALSSTHNLFSSLFLISSVKNQERSLYTTSKIDLTSFSNIFARSRVLQAKCFDGHLIPVEDGFGDSSTMNGPVKHFKVSLDHASTPEQTKTTVSVTVVGASGDLAKKKIFPALFALYYENFLPEHFTIFGYARSKMSDEELRNMISKTLTCRIDKMENCGDKMEKFLQRCFYQSGQYDSEENFRELDEKLKEKEAGRLPNRLFYLSIPPNIFVDVVRCASCCASSPTGWTRVIVEKPFGRDSESSRELTTSLKQYLTEDQIFRIDHYLGKELVENLSVLRFSNLVFEPLWSRQYIRNVQLIFSEEFGTEGRGGYFDSYGIIRDIMQNHLLQILALFAMETPVSLEAEDIRNEKVKVLRSMRPLEIEDVVIGQYKGHSKGGRSYPSYTDDPKVPNNSLTPTFAAAAMFIDNARWDGVPFLMKAGKALHSSGKMFSWRRPSDMALHEPIDEAIWEMIDQHDPQGVVSVRDRLAQYEDMIAGRSVFGGFFVHSPVLPDCSLDPSVFRDPPTWVTSVRLRCGEFHPLESTVERVSWGICDILEPAADTIEPPRQSRSLAHRLLQHELADWPRDSSLGQSPPLPCGYVRWTRYVLQAHRDVLRRAGVYEAVYASMFSYDSLPPSWTRGVMEFWDPTTSTCWIGPDELTITLWELRVISGLPIHGRRYEEYIPSEEELFHRQISADGSRYGETVLPAVLPALLSHYQRVFRASRSSTRSRSSSHSHDILPLDAWIQSFLRTDCLDQPRVQLRDPFELGVPPDAHLTESFAEPLEEVGHDSPALPGIDEEMFLAGFLITWLSTFVLPVRRRFVRANIFLVASLISRGERISLAPVVLCQVYRVLRATSVSSSLDIQDILPWQYVQAWVHLHVRGAFGCLDFPSFFTERGYPTVMQLVQAASTLERERVRLFFFAPHLVVDRFQLVHRPEAVTLPDSLTGVDLTDRLDLRSRRPLLSRARHLAVREYFISLRPGWLCYRFDQSVFLEGYHPNRVARQFGYSQATAYSGLPLLPGVVDSSRMTLVPLEPRLHIAAIVWTHLLRLGTDSSFRIAPSDSLTGVSFTHLSWVRQSFGTFMERGVNRYEPQVRRLGMPRGQRSYRRGSQLRDHRQETPRDFTTVPPQSRDVRGSEMRRDTWRDSTTAPSQSRGARDTEMERDTQASPEEAETASPPSRVRPRWPSPLHSRSRQRTEPFGASMGQPSSSVLPEIIVSAETQPEPLPPADDLPELAPIDPQPGSVSDADLSESDSFMDLSEPTSPEDILSEPESPVDPSEPDLSEPLSPTDVQSEAASSVGLSELPLPDGVQLERTSLVDSPTFSATTLPSPTLLVPVLPQRSLPDHGATSGSASGGPTYESEIPHRRPLDSGTYYSRMLDCSVSFLQSLICGLDPLSPETLDNFVHDANATLDFLCQLGMEGAELQFWETCCRQAEFFVRQMRSTRIFRSRLPLSEFRERVRLLREAADRAHDDYEIDLEILRQHRARSAEMAEELDRLDSRIQVLQRELGDLDSQRATLRDTHSRSLQVIERDQERFQLRQRGLTEVEAALTGAVDELHIVEEEHQFLVQLVSQLRDFQRRFD